MPAHPPEAADMDAVGGAPSADRAYDHLREADPVLARLMDEDGIPEGEFAERASGRLPQGDNYAALVRSIVGQQLSTFAARAIYGRMLERFGGHPPTTQQILDDDPEELRTSVGLSHAKVRYLRSLAEHIVSGELDLEHFDGVPDDEVIARLTAVKGIGEWSAHLFLMFQLARPDVLAVGDLGIRRAVQRAYDMPALPTPAELTKLAEPWRPYRTAACLVLWSSLHNEPT
jgi:DNA-3-methyladenine glycosylase II